MDNSEVFLEKTFKESSKSVFCLRSFDELTSNGFLEQSSQPARVIINLLVKPKPLWRTISANITTLSPNNLPQFYLHLHFVSAGSFSSCKMCIQD